LADTSRRADALIALQKIGRDDDLAGHAHARIIAAWKT
jgi:hypothetical protein